MRTRERAAPIDPVLRLGPLALVLGLCFIGCGDAAGPEPCAGKSLEPGTREVFLEWGGRERRFVVTVPERALDGPAPLVLAFHGVFSSPEAILATTGLPAKAEAEGFVIAAPAGVERSWNAGVCCDPAMSLSIDDAGFAREVVRSVQSELCIDPERVYATGFSNGAAMTFRLACEAADLFAASAPVAGAVASRCEPSRARPILIINNLDDPIVPFVLGEVAFDQLAGVNACSADRTVTEPAPNTSCATAPSCAEGTSTGLCAVAGISHVWPGGALDPEGPFRATDAIWDFFATAGH